MTWRYSIYIGHSCVQFTNEKKCLMFRAFPAKINNEYMKSKSSLPWTSTVGMCICIRHDPKSLL